MGNNPPHFHAQYGDYKISVDILNGVVEGKFPGRVLSAVLEWLEKYREQLIEDWELASKHDNGNLLYQHARG